MNTDDPIVTYKLYAFEYNFLPSISIRLWD